MLSLKVASPFDVLTDNHIERKVLKLKADFLILLTMDYGGEENGVAHFAQDHQITLDEARAMLTGQLSELSLDLLMTCLFRKGYDMTRQLVHPSLMNMQLSR